MVDPLLVLPCNIWTADDPGNRHIIHFLCNIRVNNRDSDWYPIKPWSSRFKSRKGWTYPNFATANVNRPLGLSKCDWVVVSRKWNGIRILDLLVDTWFTAWATIRSAVVIVYLLVAYEYLLLYNDYFFGVWTLLPHSKCTVSHRNKKKWAGFYQLAHFNSLH